MPPLQGMSADTLIESYSTQEHGTSAELAVSPETLASIGHLPFTALSACYGMDVEIFIPEKGTENAVRDIALSTCAECVVREACLEYAIETGVPGYWGGTSEAQRRQIKRQRRQAEKQAKEAARNGSDQNRETV